VYSYRCIAQHDDDAPRIRSSKLAAPMTGA
jgi:hypothetical protein